MTKLFLARRGAKSVCLLVFIWASMPLLAEEQWSQFRGPTGEGHAGQRLPVNWSEIKNIVWKTPIHDRGWSSPVIWKNQIWLTTAVKDGSKLFAVCVDRHSGKLVHDIDVFDVKMPPRVAAINSYASPTPVVEEGRVYVHFGTYGTACIDTATGAILWQRRDLNCDHEVAAGPGSSPFLVGDKLVMNVDGRDVQYVIALDKLTGKTAWLTKRSVDYSAEPINERKAYCMPIVIPRGEGQQLVSPGAKALVSYDATTGDELWAVRYKGWSIAPRPVFGHGLVFAIVDHDHPELWAIRPDGTGDVTESHVVWKEPRGMPSRSSPLLVGDLLFTASHDGIATCLEARTGKTLWKNRLEGNFSASPIHAAGKIYFFNEHSACTVIRATKEFEVLATNRLSDERLMASPAAAEGALIVRTENYLYRMEESSAE
jgi:outer membrane protein assembly factor BamB